MLRGRLADSILRPLQPWSFCQVIVIQAARPRKPPHRTHHCHVARAQAIFTKCTHVRVANWSPRKARPQRVTKRATGQREAERVVLVHRVGDEANTATRVKQVEMWRVKERMACMRAHRQRGSLRVRDSGLDAGPRHSRHGLSRHNLGLGCRRCHAQIGVRGGCFALGSHRNDDQHTNLIRH